MLYTNTLEGVEKYLKDLGFDAHVIEVSVNVDHNIQQFDTVAGGVCSVAGPQDITIDITVVPVRPAEYISLGVVVQDDYTSRYEHAMAFLKDL